ncbi:unnamed protein product [Vitrella brassicaformis CCMP3155]|uniref:Uncharacterized protein n=1 Tax=Vitrella brassicaformis (strain CCMP3155) TaxID=1169540 RepID=A0A0G4EC21_VITBC|nr:unnamed protein product [Vitrella brassicaformis CCMP3155]|eukprot:CEL93540.1 unnamed protein product [Vitrella brassicaformis CCMP3155]
MPAEQRTRSKKDDEKKTGKEGEREQRGASSVWDRVQPPKSEGPSTAEGGLKVSKRQQREIDSSLLGAISEDGQLLSKSDMGKVLSGRVAVYDSHTSTLPMSPDRPPTGDLQLEQERQEPRQQQEQHQPQWSDSEEEEEQIDDVEEQQEQARTWMQTRPILDEAHEPLAAAHGPFYATPPSSHFRLIWAT